MQVVDRSGGLRFGIDGGGLLVDVKDGLLCGGPIEGGGLLGGGVADGLRCGGADAELLQLQLRLDVCGDDFDSLTL